MTTAGSHERIVTLREQVQVAHTAASTARTARRASQEASRLAGSLADRRAAADAEVAEATRRLRAVQGLHPVRLAHLVRGHAGHEVAVRAERLDAATRTRDAIVAEAHEHLEQARRLSAEADAAAASAAALPRLLDDLACLIHDVGGNEAARLAEADARIAPPLTDELALSHALQATRHARARVREAIEQLVSAHAWGAGGTDHAVDAVTTAVLTLRRETPKGPLPVRAATDRWLRWAATVRADTVRADTVRADGTRSAENASSASRLQARTALELARELAAEFDVAVADAAQQRSRVRRAVAGSRAVQIEILRGVAA